MLNLDKLIQNRIFQNVIVWVLVFLIFIGLIQSENSILSTLVVLSILIPAIYINNLLILPYLKNNRLVFSFLFLANTAFFSAVSIFTLLHSLGDSFEWKMLTLSGIILLAILFGSAVKISRDSFALRQHEKEAELKLLKAQLNPHFLFNTLNNLYGLSVLKSDKLPDLMLKLSDLLRYSLYDTKDKLVLLNKEISYLENYISLERIRLEDKTTLVFNKQGDFGKIAIPPMLFIVFVENAFKYIDINDDVATNVQIDLAVNDGDLEFTCSNSYSEVEKTNLLGENEGGIGLQNVKKRLQLIYPNKHQLKIDKDGSRFKVFLKIKGI